MRKFIRDLKKGDVTNEVFLLRKIIPKEEVEMIVCDKSGEIKVKFPDAKEVKAKPGEFLRIKNGVVVSDGKELKILLKSAEDIEKVDEKEVDIKDILPSLSEEEIERILKELKSYIKSIKNKFLRKLLEDLFEDEDFLEKFKYTPSSVDHHHNYIGGNLEHTLSVVKICDFISKIYKNLDRDLLISGAILHDIGKAFEYQENKIYEKTDEGILLGHIMLGEREIRKRINGLRSKGLEFPENLENLLTHVIISHHGKREWGSPEIPKTLESLSLHLADLMDSRIRYHEQKIEEGEEKWKLIWDNDIKKRKVFLVGDVNEEGSD